MISRELMKQVDYDGSNTSLNTNVLIIATETKILARKFDFTKPIYILIQKQLI